jgi:ElaB/YqjD/DUF883 family membrane-anchored ribosome-binding protein
MSATTLKKSTNAQVRRLQTEIEAMVRDTIAPTLGEIVAKAAGPILSRSNQVREYSKQAREYSDTVAGGVRSRPLISVLVSAAIGFVVGRLTAGGR